MSFYCLCEADNGKPDSQAFMAPNRYCAIDGPSDEEALDGALNFPPLALKTKMVCIKTGANQVILYDHKPNDWSTPVRPRGWRRHHPNVDVFECPNCRARIVRE